MAVRIRLTRVGATKRPAYRVIAIDRRRSRDGRALEILGFYDPLTEPATVQLKSERISAWIGKGAQPSDTVVRLMRQAEKAASAPALAEKPKRPSRPKAAPKPKKEPAATAEEPAAKASAALAADGTDIADGEAIDTAAAEATVAVPEPSAETAAVEAAAGDEPPAAAHPDEPDA